MVIFGYYLANKVFFGLAKLANAFIFLARAQHSNFITDLNTKSKMNIYLSIICEII